MMPTKVILVCILLQRRAIDHCLLFHYKHNNADVFKRKANQYNDREPPPHFKDNHHSFL